MTHTDLNELSAALQKTNEQSFRGIELSFKDLTKQVESLRAWVNGQSSDRAQGDGRIKEALRQFYQSPTINGLPQARLLTFGCTVRLSRPEFTLIEDAERFPRLIDGVDKFHRSPKAYRRCYKGLLAAYFSYDPDGMETVEEGSKNWTLLRSYLEARVSALEDNGRSEWIPTVREHQNLLSSRPCDRYAGRLLKDDDKLFQEAKSKLEIADASWVVRRLVLAQISAAASQSDTQFNAYLQKLLELIGEYALIKDEGLAIVLDRYAACASTPIHSELRDTAVASWGNPWMSHNSARWSRVSDRARGMVTAWLKHKVIGMFFSLLTEDGTADTRRLKFWQQHHEQIDDMYFALGSYARFNLNSSFVELRDEMSGRLLELYGAGSPENNAFIMCIGNKVVVEFGKSGNACFVFDRDRLPFRLSGTVKGDSTSLKHEQHKQRLIHTDSRWKKWESKFVDAIPDLRAGRRTTSTQSYGGTERNSASQTSKSYSRSELSAFCAARGIRIEDLSGKGGNLWLRTANANPQISSQLTAWGFRYKDGKGWWRD